MRISDWSSDVCSSDLATSAVPLDGTRAAVRTRETNLGNLVADSLLWQGRQLAGSFGLDQPVIALQNGGGIRNDAVIPAGPVSRADAFTILPVDKDRKSVVQGTRWSGRVNAGGHQNNKKKK